MLMVMFIWRCSCSCNRFATILITTETSLWLRCSVFARNSKRKKTSLVSCNNITKLSEGTLSVTHGLFALHGNGTGTGTWTKRKCRNVHTGLRQGQGQDQDPLFPIVPVLFLEQVLNRSMVANNQSFLTPTPLVLVHFEPPKDNGFLNRKTQVYQLLLRTNFTKYFFKKNVYSSTE